VLQIKFGKINIFINKNYMVQPKYSPEEALQRIKLMMEYDSSKTLTENKEKIQLINEIAPLIWVAGAALAAAPLATIGTWIYNVQGGGDAFIKTQSFFQGCSSLDKNLKPTQNKSDHREAADTIYNAIQGFGTDEDAIKGAISSMETVADLCAMHRYYNKTYGDLYDDLDSDLDGESFRRYVWSSIAPIVEDAENDLENTKKDEDPIGVDCRKNPNDAKCRGGGGGTSKFKPCSGTYQFGCKSDVIAKVQGCLGGLVPDGKLGNLTLGKLKEKGYTSFTDADVDKICGTTPKPPVKPTGVEDLEDDNSASTTEPF